MPTFVLELYQSYPKCAIYTVQVEGSELSEFEKFLTKFLNSDYKEDLQQIASFIKNEIGSRYGASDHFFRFENQASALPPYNYIQRKLKISLSTNLRLYCYVISEDIIVLFNGSVKDAPTAQQSDASIFFRDANRFSKIIAEAIQNDDLLIDHQNKILTDSEGNKTITL